MIYECHGFAGLGYPFTAGGTRSLEKLIDDLPARAGADHHPYWDADDVAYDIIKKRTPNKVKIAMFAHSWGVKTGLEACAILDKAGFHVAYFAAIDPTALRASDDPMVIPDNVEYVDEFWSTRGFINFPKWARRDKTGERGGMCVNAYKVPHKVHHIAAGHIASASHPTTRRIIVNKMAEILR